MCNADQVLEDTGETSQSIREYSIGVYRDTLYVDCPGNISARICDTLDAPSLKILSCENSQPSENWVIVFFSKSVQWNSAKNQTCYEGRQISQSVKGGLCARRVQEETVSIQEDDCHSVNCVIYLS